MSQSSILNAQFIPISGSPLRSALPPLFPTNWASCFGQDPHGFWCGFEISSAFQCLRWIPPGEFLVGSPEDEPKRNDDELLHQVKLTQGYWLAETACTQALWKGGAPMRARVAGMDKAEPTVLAMRSWSMT